MHFGMPSLIEIPELEDIANLCKSLGLDFIELNMNIPRDFSLLYQADRPENTERLREIQEKYGIYFTIHLDENLNVCDFNKAVAEAYSNTVLRMIETAKRISVPILNMHMNHGVHFTLPDRKVELYELYFDEYMDAWKSFRRKCEAALADTGIKICIENTDGYRGYEKRAIEYLLESDIFGLTWDIGHSNAAGNIDEPFIMDHKERLFHFHIHDSLGTKDHMVLGAGEINLGERLKMAEELQCRCVVETKTVEALKESVDWLDACNP